MRQIVPKIMIVAVMLGLAEFGWATTAPDQSNAKSMTVAQLEAAGDAARAQKDYEQATKLNKRYSDAFNNIGAIYYPQRDYDKAVKYFKKAAALEETRATFH